MSLKDTIIIILSFVLICSATPTIAYNNAEFQFLPGETVVGDPSYGCLGMEFSPNMKWLVWTQQGSTKASWLCGMNPVTGDLIPNNGRPNAKNGKPFFIPNIPSRGNPQWGQDSKGSFIIAINNDGRLVQVRPGILGSDGNWSTDPVIPTLSVPANSTRQFPFAARLPERANSYVVYEQLANGTGAAGIYWVDLGDPKLSEHLVVAPPGYTMPPTLQNIAATIYRWFPGLTVFTYTVIKKPGGAVKIAQLDVSAPTPTPIAINPNSDNVSFHTDDFPSVNFDRQTIIGGVSSSATARYYFQDPVTKLTSTLADITVKPSMSALKNPQWATSFEPFEWNDRVYSAFQVIDGADPIKALPSEIWLTSLSDSNYKTDTSLLHCISSKPSLQRRDPEYFLGSTNVWIFYYAKSSGNQFTIYRAESGLPERQAKPMVLTSCEVQIGDSNIAYKDPEFWIQGRKVAWQDGEDKVWLADVDPKSGEWIPANGKGRFIGKAANIEADQSTSRPGSWNGPEWGFSQQGPAVYYTMIDGSNVNQQARFRLNTGLTEQITFGGRRGRSGTLPSKEASDIYTRIMYFIGRFGTGQEGEAHWQLENDNSSEAKLPATDWAFSGPQWIPGHQAIVTNQRDALGVQQVAWFDTRTGNAKNPKILTTDQCDKVDTYFFKAPEYGGELVFITLLDKQDIGFYRQIDSKWTLQRKLQVPVTPKQGEKLTVFSAEPFSFGNRSYISFAVTFGKAYQSPSWIYIMSIDGTYVEQVSSRSNIARIDPEYFYTEKDLFIYYYSVGGNKRRLYLSKLTLPEVSETIISAPQVIFKPLPNQFANVKQVKDASYAWSITGGTIEGPVNQNLISFTTDKKASSVSIKVIVTTPSQTLKDSVDIPVIQAAQPLKDGKVQGSGQRAYPLFQMLRGERIKVIASPSIPLALYDIQGRRIASGTGLLDTRLPVRGSYILVAESEARYQLEVLGVRKLFTREDSDSDIKLTGVETTNEAQPGVLSKSILTLTYGSTGESLVRTKNSIVATWYDIDAKQSVIAQWSQTGVPCWTWRSLQSDDIYLRTLSPMLDGGVVAIGSCGAAGPADKICILRLNAQGELLWNSQIFTADYDFGYGICASGDGIYVSGFTQGAFANEHNAGQTDAFIALLDVFGKLKWIRQFGSTQEDRAFAISLTAEGIVTFGDTRGQLGALDTGAGAGSNGDLFIAWFSFDGAIKTIKHFGSDKPDLAFDMRVGNDGSLYLTGMTRGVMEVGTRQSLMPQVFLLEIKPSGSIGWHFQLGPKEGQSAESLDLMDNRILLLFYTNGSFPPGVNDSLGTHGSDDMVIAEFTTNGELTRVHQFYDTSERIFARGITQTTNGIYVLCDHVYLPGEPFSTVSVNYVSP